jgi:hypothetical protein
MAPTKGHPVECRIMQLHIVKDGQQRGPYSHMQIVEMLRAGELSEGDLAWQTGMVTWMPLREVQDFQGATTPRERPPRSRSGQNAEAPRLVRV